MQNLGTQKYELFFSIQTKQMFFKLIIKYICHIIQMTAWKISLYQQENTDPIHLTQ